jgi:hypothetical protein
MKRPTFVWAAELRSAARFISRISALLFINRNRWTSGSRGFALSLARTVHSCKWGGTSPPASALEEEDDDPDRRPNSLDLLGDEAEAETGCEESEGEGDGGRDAKRWSEESSLGSISDSNVFGYA